MLYALHIAKLFKATLVVSGFEEVGYHEYSGDTAEMLGISLNLTAETVYQIYNPRDLSLRYYDLMKVRDEVSRGISRLHCNTAIHSQPWSCRKNYLAWCTSLVDYPGYVDISPTLRNLKTADSCKRAGLGFPSNSSTLNILLHLRNGKYCNMPYVYLTSKVL